ncbi:MAG: lipoate--protein ligase [Piscinibacter sp.]|nr:lipoate--protein ligase [Piscinibacter sp.]
MGLPRFAFVTVHDDPLADGIAAEDEWLVRCAELKRASAHLWRGTESLVVPRRYTAQPGWAAALAALPPGAVQVRASGGGLVPQGPGLWNLSLIWPAPGATPTGTDAVYLALCDALGAAFARLGVEARAQPVEGSFCDGRFNLAVGGRKLVGTAQAWKRVAGVPLVLAHAVLIVAADPQALTARANAFEALLGSGTRYRADALTSIAHEAPGPDVEARTLQAIAEQFARIVRRAE